MLHAPRSMRVVSCFMMLSREEVIHIANLARIKLTEEEIEKFQKELSLILDYMEKLKKIDTTDISSRTSATFLYNVARKDEIIHDSAVAGELLKEIPEIHEGYVKVKTIL